MLHIPVSNLKAVRGIRTREAFMRVRGLSILAEILTLSMGSFTVLRFVSRNAASPAGNANTVPANPLDMAGFTAKVAVDSTFLSHLIGILTGI